MIQIFFRDIWDCQFSYFANVYIHAENLKKSDWKCDFLAKQLTTNQHGHFEAQQNGFCWGKTMKGGRDSPKNVVNCMKTK